METKRDVFLQLLEAWEQKEEQVIWEFSGNIEGETKEMKKEKQSWIARFEVAKDS